MRLILLLHLRPVSRYIQSECPRLKPSRKGDLAASCSLCFPRRSERLAKRSSLDAETPHTTRRRRKLSQSTCALRGAGEDSPPAWLQQNGHFDEPQPDVVGYDCEIEELRKSVRMDWMASGWDEEVLAMKYIF